MAATTFLNGSKQRLYLFGGILFLWFGLVSCRLIQLQVVRYSEWMQRAQRQQRRVFNDISPRRGIIFDRNGNELAMTVNVDSVFAVPSEIPDHAMAANLLANVVGMEPKEIFTHLEASKNFCWIARKVDAETSNRVRALNLRGIYFQKEPKRFYPKRELAAQVLGYVGLDDAGLAGIELAYDEMLRGIPGQMQVSVDARRARLGRTGERQPEPGENIVLTIDQNIQYIAERELDRAMEETKAEAATIIVENPRTGEILALANRPTFNPNTTPVPIPALKNRAVSDVYEPGSTFKLVTVSGALEEKLTNPEEPIDCRPGYIVVGGVKIRDHNSYGTLTVNEVLAKSSGVGAIKLGLRLGEDRLYKYVQAYGFGSLTGIELPGESRGLTKPVNRWSKVSIGSISMGQEVGITPVQLASMVSAIANDGVWSPPRILAGATPPGSTHQTVVFRPSGQRRVISTLTSAQMRKAMEGVVLFGTGRKAILDGYTSAGKTGTAQKLDPRTGGYSKTKYVGSFAGFAPVNSPAVTVAVIIDSAVGLHQGGQVAAPVFQRVVQQVLAYMHVPHDAEFKNPNRLLMRASVKDKDLEEGIPDHPGEPLEITQAQPDSRATLVASSAQQGRIVPVVLKKRVYGPLPSVVETQNTGPLPQSVQPGNVPNTGTVVLPVGMGAIVPNFVGKSVRNAVEAAQEAGVEMQVIGSGTAREQIPPPGSRIAPGSRVIVRFTR